MLMILNREQVQILIRSSVWMLGFRQEGQEDLINGDRESMIFGWYDLFYNDEKGQNIPDPGTVEAIEVEAGFVNDNLDEIDKINRVLIDILKTLPDPDLTEDQIEMLSRNVTEYIECILYSLWDTEDKFLGLSPNTSYMLSRVADTMKRYFNDPEMIDNANNEDYWNDEYSNGWELLEYLDKYLPKISDPFDV